MVCGTLISIFLPKSSEMTVNCKRDEIQNYVNTWTTRTTILVCTLCFPFIVAADEILSAYVGAGNAYLSKWLQLWCFFLIVQMHSTPAFSFILAKGKTKVLVIATAIASILSIIVNICLSSTIPVGSAIIGYAVYMICLIGVYYIHIYKYYLNFNRLPIFKSFLVPLLIGFMACIIPFGVPMEDIHIFSIERIDFIVSFIIKSLMWFIPYAGLLFLFRVVKISDLRR